MLLILVLGITWGLLIGVIIFDARDKKEPQSNSDAVIANWTKVLALSTILLFLATLMTAFILHETDEKVGDQAKVVHRQLTLMETDQRPWISLENAHVRALTISENEAEIVVQFALANSGKTPARFLTLNGSFIWATGEVRSIYAGWDVCSALRSSKSYSGTTVFPGKSTLHNGIFRMSKDNVDAWKIWSIDKLVAAPYVVGCIDYVFASGEEGMQHHQTAFVFEIDRLKDKENLGPVFYEVGRVPVGDLVLSIHPSLSKYAD